MKKITKSLLMLLFTLVGVVSVQAQEVPAKDAWFTGADFFRFRAKKNATEPEYAAFADKVEPGWGVDPADATNGCIVALCAPGTDTTSQLWIRGAEKDDADGFAVGEGCRVTMKVKADVECEVTTTAHKNFGYFTATGFGKVKVTKEWQTVSIPCIAVDGSKNFTDLCLNLSGDTQRTFYFDDIQIVRGNSEWYLNNDFHAKDYLNPDATYSDGANPHPVARYNAEEGCVEVKSNAGASQTYNSQLWIAIPQEFVGTMTKMTMEVQATKAITCPESFQATATGNGWGCNPGPGKGVEFKVGEWTTIERVLNTKNVKSTGTWKDLQADQYCLDLSDVSDAKEAVVYQFKNVKFEQAYEDWYTANPVFAKDYTNGTETYTDGVKFPKAPYIFGSGDEGGYIEVVSNADATNDYASQIFFEIPEALRGKNVQISMKVKASQDISVATALHGTADGNGWSGNPSGGAVDFTVGNWVDIKRTFNTDCKDKNGDPVAYYVMNLSDNNGKKAIKYDFDEVAFDEFIDWGELTEVPVEGTLVQTQDWTTATSYSGWSVLNDNTTLTVKKGEGLIIENKEELEQAYTSQFFVADGFKFEEGKQYAVRYTVKINGEGTIRTDVNHWGDGVADNGVDYTGKNVYKQFVFVYGVSPVTNNGYHVIFQPGKFIGKIILEKVELFDTTPKYDEMDWSDNIIKNGDLKGDDMSEFYLKNNDVENPETLMAEKTEFGGAFEIDIETAARPAGETEGSVGGNDHDAQFFVRLPYVLPKGKLFNLEFDLYAEQINTLAIQAHAEPGQWKANMTEVKTDPSVDAVHFQKYISAPADMRTIAINLAVATDATYAFSNFSVKYVKDDEADIKTATEAADAASMWAEMLAVNEAAFAGRNADKEGCTSASVKALEDAIAAGKAELAKTEGVTKESLTAAAKAIEDAIKGLEKLEYALDNFPKVYAIDKEVTSLDALKEATFFLVNEDGEEPVMLYTPSGWDIKAAPVSTALSNLSNGGYYKLEADGDNFFIPVFNFDKSVRTYWAGNQYVNAQPTGNVIFGLAGPNDQKGQDGPNLAVWTITYEEGKGFAFKCVGRDIYIGHNNGAACPSTDIVYWKAYTDFTASYDKGEAEGVGDLAAAAVRTADAKKALEDAKAAYEADGDLDKYGDAVNAAVTAIKACEAVPAGYQDLDAAGKAAADKAAASYEAGEFADIEALRAAYREAAKAQTTAGANMTGAIINPSFELGNTNGWTVENSNDTGAKENSNGTYTMTNCDGKYVFNIWSSGNAISQTIEGLPNGTYKLQAVIATDADHKVQLNGNDKSAQVDAVDKGTGVEGEVEFEVTDGKATIGAEGVDKYWYKVDNFRLTFVEAAVELLPAPETDPDYADFTKIPFAQEDQEAGDIHLAPMTDKGEYTQFTTTEGICVVFKMKNIDVTDCDYITIKFAKPAPAGQSWAVWTGTTNKPVEEGASEIKYVFADDPDCKVENGILPEVSIISIYTAGGADVSVYGVYKHKAGATDINEVEDGESLADGKYIENGQIVIVKGGKKYTAAGVEIK